MGRCGCSPLYPADHTRFGYQQGWVGGEIAMTSTTTSTSTRTGVVNGGGDSRSHTSAPYKPEGTGGHRPPDITQQRVSHRGQRMINSRSARQVAMVG